MGSSSLIRDWTAGPAVGAQILSCWTIRQSLSNPFLDPFLYGPFQRMSSPVLYSKSLLVIYFIHESEVTQSCLTLCDPMDCSPPGSSIHGIFQARVLEWVAISSSRRSSRPRDGTRVSHIVGRCFTVLYMSVAVYRGLILWEFISSLALRSLSL